MDWIISLIYPTPEFGVIAVLDRFGSQVEPYQN
jgi:hypothetical protein